MRSYQITAAETSHCVDLIPHLCAPLDGQFLFWQSQLFAIASPFSIVENHGMRLFFILGHGFIT